MSEDNRIFGKNNVNADIFEVPTETGYDIEDQFNASIGDATAKHILGLGHKVIYWEHFIRMADGNLFTIEPSFNYKEDEDLEKYSLMQLERLVKKGKLSNQSLEDYKAALAKNSEEDTASEDVMNQRGLLVSYEDWEANPGQSTQSWDLPQTPKPYAKYAGNCKQMFYDEFPEDHPDADLINEVLTLLNRDWDAITGKFAKQVIKVIQRKATRPETSKYLSEMVDKIAYGNDSPEAVAIECLSKIDNIWGRFVSRTVLAGNLANDPIHRYFNDMCKEFDAALKKRETTTNKIYIVLKQLGRVLYGKKQPLIQQGIDTELNNHHWATYRKMKKRYAPEIAIRGININKAYVNELVNILGIKRETARKVIMLRPFESIEDLRRTGLVTLENIVYQSQGTAEILNRINLAAGHAVEKKDFKLLSGLPAIFIQEQKANKHNLSKEEWKQIWECYNIEKTKVLKVIKSAV